MIKRIFVFLGLKVLEIFAIAIVLTLIAVICYYELLFFIILGGLIFILIILFLVENWEWAGEICERRRKND